MVEQPIQVDVQIAGRDVPAGQLWTNRRGQNESATFSYRDDYLELTGSYELEPRLPLQAGQHQTPVKQPLFGAMSDCAPDGWGRRLVRRAEARRARQKRARSGAGSQRVDFLLGARDGLRQGALRLRPRREQYLATDGEGVRI
jgi:serine/threonine-protein kinase HipA